MKRKGNTANKAQGKKAAESKKGAVFTVSENAGLMEFLMAQMPGKSRTKIKLLLSRKQVLVDGEPISQFNHPLTPRQKVEISKGSQESYKSIKQSRELSIVFEDAEAGVEAAINGGMRCVGIGSPKVLGKANFVVPGFEGFSFETLELGLNK